MPQPPGYRQHLWRKMPGQAYLGAHALAHPGPPVLRCTRCRAYRRWNNGSRGTVKFLYANPSTPDSFGAERPLCLPSAPKGST